MACVVFMKFAMLQLEYVEQASALPKTDEERLDQLRRPWKRGLTDATTILSGDISPAVQVDQVRSAFGGLLTALTGSSLSISVESRASLFRLRHFFNCLYAAAQLCDVARRTAAASFVRVIFVPARRSVLVMKLDDFTS
jgi:hypothetical protein